MTTLSPTLSERSFSNADFMDLPSIRFEALLIGVSTGGPVALRDFLPGIPKNFPLPIFITQHMPPKYTLSLAERLNDLCQVKVLEAAEGMIVEPGTAYIAPGGFHMKLSKKLNGAVVVRLSDDPPECSCRPAVDVMFRSATDLYQGRAVGVILTGMGKDGTEGSRYLKQKGGFILAQHSQGCCVYGMPKSVVDEGLADRIYPLPLMAGAINKLIRKSLLS